MIKDRVVICDTDNCKTLAERRCSVCNKDKCESCISHLITARIIVCYDCDNKIRMVDVNAEMDEQTEKHIVQAMQDTVALWEISQGSKK